MCAFSGRGLTAIHPIQIHNRSLEVLRGLEVINIEATVPTGTQLDTAYSAGTDPDMPVWNRGV